MLLEFKLGNIFSFKDKATFSLLASSIKEHETNYFHASDHSKLLKSAVVYGANASGKSNLIKAVQFAKNFILNSSKDTQSLEPIDIHRFELSTQTENQPSFFEFTFISSDGVKYRYGFEVDESKVWSEWLFASRTSKEANLFLRDSKGIKIRPAFKEGKGLEKKTRGNALFISVAAQFNGEVSNQILNWFNELVILSGLSDSENLSITLELIKHKEYSDEIIDLVKSLDLGIDGIKKKEIEFENISVPKDIKSKFGATKIQIDTIHKKYNSKNQVEERIEFPLTYESAGTTKLFALAGPIIDAIKNGKVILIDELDSKLHPIMTRFIVSIFNSLKLNKKNAQLIFTTHDTNILTNQIFRRDQIWFTEKNKYGASDLYSLVEYQVRPDASYNKDYIAGKYGAIPYITNLNNFFEEIYSHEK